MQKIYGPYERKDGRQHVVIVTENSVQTKSYPRFLMEKFLGRNLENFENVDHINGNKTDNRIENLQLLTREENSSKSALKLIVPDLICPLCSVSFKPTKNQLKTSKKTAGPFCSRQCAGKYGAFVQNSYIETIPNQLIGMTLHYKNNEGQEFKRTVS